MKTGNPRHEPGTSVATGRGWLPQPKLTEIATAARTICVVDLDAIMPVIRDVILIASARLRRVVASCHARAHEGARPSSGHLKGGAIFDVLDVLVPAVPSDADADMWDRLMSALFALLEGAQTYRVTAEADCDQHARVFETALPRVVISKLDELRRSSSRDFALVMDAPVPPP